MELTYNQIKLLLFIQREDSVDWDEIHETGFNFEVYVELLNLDYIISVPIGWPFTICLEGFYTLTEKGWNHLKMSEAIQEIFKIIVDMNSRDDVQVDIQEAKLEYLHDGWEEDFDNEDEAYEELGRNEAEDQIINELINSNDGENLSLDDHCTLAEELAEHYEIAIN